jgi:formate C-acetyltransferase
MAGGGGSVHFNVLSPEVLRKAQAEPEKYRNLQIRLCGWNVRFVNLNKQEQDEFILQAAQENGL